MDDLTYEGKTGRNSGKKGRGSGIRPNKTFIRLAVSLWMLLTAVILSRFSPESFEIIKERLNADVNYEAAISVLGEALRGDRSFTEAFGEAYSLAFSAKSEDMAVSADEFAARSLPPSPETDEITGDDPDFNGSLGIETSPPADGGIIESFGFSDGEFRWGAVISGENVYAFADGVVSAAGESSIYGNYIIVGHANGVTSVYGRLNDNYAEEGDSVGRGEIIGTTYGELYFELLRDGEYIDPESFI